MTELAFTTILHQYGSLGIVGLLSLGIVGLPIPDETLLLVTGILVNTHQLEFFAAWLACMLGPIIGISVSYTLGYTLGHFAIIKLCRTLKLSSTHLEQTRAYFNKMGAWLLLVGYFIPGVRHFTGLLAGAAQLPYKRFALFAYTGAFLWANTFFWLGYIYGNQALNFLMQLYHRYGLLLLLLFICLSLAVFIIWKIISGRKTVS